MFDAADPMRTGQVGAGTRFLPGILNRCNIREVSMEAPEDNQELDLLLPSSVTGPLWKSLLRNLRDRFFPEKLPPLQLTSRPVNTGMLIGDAVSLPWYRTVFTNLGNVINPEVLPPLELESRPMDVGELVSDQMGHMWWTSLLRNLADRVAPERLPPLQLTSAPVDADLNSGIHAIGALVFADHAAQGSAGGAEVLYRRAGAAERASHRASGAIRRICGNAGGACSKERRHMRIPVSCRPRSRVRGCGRPC